MRRGVRCRCYILRSALPLLCAVVRAAAAMRSGPRCHRLDPTTVWFCMELYIMFYILLNRLGIYYLG